MSCIENEIILENLYEKYLDLGYDKDMAYEFGYLDGNPNDYNPLHYHIDWQGWADAVAMDYNQTEFDGDDYYWRA